MLLTDLHHSLLSNGLAIIHPTVSSFKYEVLYEVAGKLDSQILRDVIKSINFRGIYKTSFGLILEQKSLMFCNNFLNLEIKSQTTFI